MLYYLGGVNTIEKTHSSGHLGVLEMVYYSNVNVTLPTLPAEWGMCYVASEKRVSTTLQSVMNAKLSKQRFWHCHENRLIKTMQTIPHNLDVSVKSASLYCGVRIILSPMLV